jgi:hypothetical protein
MFKVWMLYKIRWEDDHEWWIIKALESGGRSLFCLDRQEGQEKSCQNNLQSDRNMNQALAECKSSALNEPAR